MNIQQAAAVAALCLAVAGGAQAQVSVFNTAFLAPLPPSSGNVGGYTLNGFGRNTSVLSLQERAADVQGVPGAVPYFDTWNIGTAGVVPGVYNFANLLVEAEGGATFTAITFNSYDALGVRSTFLFDLNATATTAIGSGSFTVLASCPVQSCVWIDVIGLRPPTGPWGYGGNGVALPVPEPAQWGLLGLGLALVAGVARRRRAAAV